MSCENSPCTAFFGKKQKKGATNGSNSNSSSSSSSELPFFVVNSGGVNGIDVGYLAITDSLGGPNARRGGRFSSNARSTNGNTYGGLVHRADDATWYIVNDIGPTPPPSSSSSRSNQLLAFTNLGKLGLESLSASGDVTVAGVATLEGDVTVAGGLNVAGVSTLAGDVAVTGTLSAGAIEFEAVESQGPNMFLNAGSAVDTNNIGFYGQIATNPSPGAFSGLFRKSSNQTWHLFEHVADPFANAYANYGSLQIGALSVSGAITSAVASSTLSIGGDVNTTAITIGKTSQTTTFPGNLTVTGTLTASLPTPADLTMTGNAIIRDDPSPGVVNMFTTGSVNAFELMTSNAPVGSSLRMGTTGDENVTVDINRLRVFNTASSIDLQLSATTGGTMTLNGVRQITTPATGVVSFAAANNTGIFLYPATSGIGLSGRLDTNAFYSFGGILGPGALYAVANGSSNTTGLVGATSNQLTLRISTNGCQVSIGRNSASTTATYSVLRNNADVGNVITLGAGTYITGDHFLQDFAAGDGIGFRRTDGGTAHGVTVQIQLFDYNGV